MEHAQVDAQARFEGRSLFEGRQVPVNHYLAMDVSELVEGILHAEVLGGGFRLIKVKAGRSPGEEIPLLREVRTFALRYGVKLRLDLNELLSEGECVHFLSALEASPEWIDWIEDPTPYAPAFWVELREEFGVRLALDRSAAGAPDFHRQDFRAFDVLVIKPAIDAVGSIADAAALNGKSIAFTSYLDHPLGQATAAWSAAEAKASGKVPVEAGGLLSHSVYEETPFSRAFGKSSPEFRHPVGTGFGFDSELAGLDWRPFGPSRSGGVG